METGARKTAAEGIIPDGPRLEPLLDHQHRYDEFPMILLVWNGGDQPGKVSVCGTKVVRVVGAKPSAQECPAKGTWTSNPHRPRFFVDRRTIRQDSYSTGETRQTGKRPVVLEVPTNV